MLSNYWSTYSLDKLEISLSVLFSYASFYFWLNPYFRFLFGLKMVKNKQPPQKNL